MSRRCIRIGMASLAVLASLLAAARTHAAVGLCLPEPVVARATQESEAEARKVAMQIWLDKAARHGIAYTRFQLAWCHQVRCEARSPASVTCRASGWPCRIKQVPPQGVARLPRGEQACPAIEAGARYAGD